jgi:hypothetical protein
MLKDGKKAGCEVYLQWTIGTEASTMLVCTCHADISMLIYDGLAGLKKRWTREITWRCDLAERAFVDERMVIQRFFSP